MTAKGVTRLGEDAGSNPYAFRRRRMRAKQETRWFSFRSDIAAPVFASLVVAVATFLVRMGIEPVSDPYNHREVATLMARVHLDHRSAVYENRRAILLLSK